MNVKPAPGQTVLHKFTAKVNLQIGTSESIRLPILRLDAETLPGAAHLLQTASNRIGEIWPDASLVILTLQQGPHEGTTLNEAERRRAVLGKFLAEKFMSWLEQ